MYHHLNSKNIYLSLKVFPLLNSNIFFNPRRCCSTFNTTLQPVYFNRFFDGVYPERSRMGSERLRRILRLAPQNDTSPAPIWQIKVIKRFTIDATETSIVLVSPKQLATAEPQPFNDISPVYCLLYSDF